MQSAMNWQTIQLSQVTSTPWKNGGGVTRELVAWPNNDNWDWRMSVAEVASDGGFSKFEGVERWFSVLSGNGVQLQVDDTFQTLTVSSAPFRFDGQAAVECKLISGATQDFNLMTRSTNATGVMRRLSSDFDMMLNDTKIIAIYAIKTPATAVFYENKVKNKLVIDADTLVWCKVPAETRLELATFNALWIEIEPCN